jgi:cysteine desulfurase/selenocysteine lyase
LRKLDVDFYVISGHKAYGPTGIGVLWGRSELLDAMPAFMTGGQMIECVTPTHASFRPPPRRRDAGKGSGTYHASDPAMAEGASGRDPQT